MEARLTKGGRRLSGVLAVALIALAVGVAQGLAGAKADGSATAPILYHNGHCGADNGKKSVGTATFELNKDGVLTVSVQLHGADPGRYTLRVYTGDCNDSFNLGTFKVNAGGEGAKSGSVDVSGFGRSFFADPSHNGANDSTIVDL